MIKKGLRYIAPPILLTSIGEFILKASINAYPAPTAPYTPMSGYLSLAAYVFSNPITILALIMVITGGILWLGAMSKFELSFLYPFLSTNLMLIVIGSHFILGEEVNLYRYIGVMLIMAGLVIISKSPYKASASKTN
jgi:drug/metabolite transporter (DMT)-like permease